MFLNFILLPDTFLKLLLLAALSCPSTFDGHPAMYFEKGAMFSAIILNKLKLNPRGQ